MLIKYIKVKLHNFISFDDAEFDLSDIGYALIEGRNYCKLDNAYSNGSGKSSIFNGVCFALTGETAQGISKGIENIFTNPEDCWVELEFLINSDNFIIRRYKTPKPDMKIWINGIDKSGKGIRESTKLLAEYIPDLTPTLLNSIIILGQGLPSRFTNNNPAQRKEILEILTKSDFMIESIKEKLDNRQQELKLNLRAEEDKLLISTSKIDTYKNQIKKFNEDLKVYNDLNISNELITTKEEELNSIVDKISFYENKVDDLRNNINTINSDYNTFLKNQQSTLENTLEPFNNNLNTIKSNLLSVEVDIKSLKKEIKKLDSITDICPTCGQKIPGANKPDTTDKKKELSELEIKYKELEDDSNKIADDINAIKDKFKLELKDKEKITNDTILKLKSEIDSLENSSKNLISDRIKLSDEISKYKNIINNYFNIINKIKELNNEIDSLTDNNKEISNKIDNINSHLTIVQKMITLAKREFRGILLSNIISYINSKVKQYSRIVFDTDKLDFILDGNAIDITYCDKQYENLSGGEKQKIDIIVQLALRDILSKQLNIHSNILVVDEIFDNLDLIGCRKIMSLISNLSDIESVFIISHHAQDLELTSDVKILVEKNENGISTIKVV